MTKKKKFEYSSRGGFREWAGLVSTQSEIHNMGWKCSNAYGIRP